jgi:hypothetical protein
MVIAKYNNEMMKTEVTDFDRAMEAFCVLNLLSVSLELFYFKYFLAKGINLD